DRASLLHGFELHPARERLLADALCPLLCRHDQGRDLTRLEYAQVQIDRAAGGDDDVQWRVRLSPGSAKLPIRIGERWIDGGGRPDVPRHRPQRPGADDHGVGHGTQHAHHHAVLRIEPTDWAATGLAGYVQRYHPVQRRDEVADDVG